METPIKRKKKGRPKTIYKTPGRKCKLTPSLINEIEDLIKQGYTVRDTCACIDINEATFYDWINKGNDAITSDDELTKSENGLFIELNKTLKKADSERKNSLKAKIERHGNKSWQAIAWLLERSYPNEFGQRLQETTRDETPLAINITVTDKKNPDRVKQMEKSLE